jgi:glycosyltransferase involved in cell wall biosynthesis
MRTTLFTTVYNRLEYLPKTVESVLSQSYKDFKYIIYNDGGESPKKILEPYLSDSRIKLVEAKHHGLVKSVFNCINLSESNYFGQIDSDDILKSTALEECLRVFYTLPHLGMVYTRYAEIDQGDTLLGMGSRCMRPFDRSKLLLDFHTFHFRLINRKAYNKTLGINTSLESCEDYDLCLKLSEVSDIVQIPKVLYLYRRHENQITKKVDLYPDTFKVINDALRRRKLDRTHFLSVTQSGKFILKSIA